MLEESRVIDEARRGFRAFLQEACLQLEASLGTDGSNLDDTKRRDLLVGRRVKTVA